MGQRIKIHVAIWGVMLGQEWQGSSQELFLRIASELFPEDHVNFSTRIASELFPPEDRE